MKEEVPSSFIYVRVGGTEPRIIRFEMILCLCCVSMQHGSFLIKAMHGLYNLDISISPHR